MSKSSSFKIGEHIGGRYEIRRSFGGEGKSGMGIVYVCYDHNSNEIVALKTFQDKFISSERIENNFKREALAWTKLEKHPYIVNAKYVLQLDSRLYIILEYVAPNDLGWNTLTHHLQFPISLKQTIEWGIQFCHGMEYATSKGVSPHRDIKPDNIMITQDNTLKITDFGLAKLWDQIEFNEDWGIFDSKGKSNKLNFLQLTNSGVAVGTRPWMAPEQFEGITDIRSDIYSFGIVLYQMVNGGNLPFNPRSGADWSHTHKNIPLPNFNSKLFSIIDCCVKKSPDNRYKNFKELRNDLESLYLKQFGKAPMKLPSSNELEAIEISNKGTSFFFLNFFDKAIELHKEALKINANLTRAHLGISAAYVKKRLYDQAIFESKKAIKLEPKSAQAHVCLGGAYLGKNMPDESIMEAKTALKLDPEFPNIQYTAHFLLGSALSQKNQLEDAIKELLGALRLNPKNYAAHFGLATVYKKKGLIDKAIIEYQEALKINPKSTGSYVGLASAYVKKGLIEEAIIKYQKAVEINPKLWGGHLGLATAYWKKDQIDEAIKEYKEVLKINPRFFMARLLLGQAFQKKGLLDEALKEFKEVLKTNPHIFVAHNELGATLLKKGLVDEAIKEYKEAIRLKPQSAEGYTGLGAVYLKIKRNDDAITEFQKALKFNPNHLNAHKNLGNAYVTKKQYDKAINEYEEALRINPNFAEAHNNLGNVFKDLGKFSEAIKEYNEALRIKPRYAEAHYNLGIILKSKGDFIEAIKAYKNFIKVAPPQYSKQIEIAKHRIQEMEKKLQQ